MHGHGYDGVSNMSSDAVGVQARIKLVASLATYKYIAVIIPLILLSVKVGVYLKYEMFLIVCKAAVNFFLIALSKLVA